MRNSATGVAINPPYTANASVDGTPYTPVAMALGGAENPIIFPGTPSNLALNDNTLSWSQAENTYTSFEIFYATAAGITERSLSRVVGLSDEVGCSTTGATRECIYSIANLNLPATLHHFKVAALGSTDPTSGNALRSALSSGEVSGTPPQPPSVGQNVAVTELAWIDGQGYMNIAFDQVGSSGSYRAYVNTTPSTLLSPATAIRRTPRHSADLKTAATLASENIPASFATLSCAAGRCTSMPASGTTILPINLKNGGGSDVIDAGTYFIAVQNAADGATDTTPYTPAADALGGAENPLVFPTVANPPTPTGLTARHGANGVTLNWTKSAHRHSRFSVYYASSSAVSKDNSPTTIRLRPDCISDANNDATARQCTATIAYNRLSGISDFNTLHLAVEANINLADSSLSNAIRATGTAPDDSAAGGGGGGESSSSNSFATLLVVGALGYLAYRWWKNRHAENGDATEPSPLLPKVGFALDRNDNRAFFTRMNWANSAGSNWQLRGNANFHTKYSGKLLDWHADSHIGYRLNGKFGDFNPYLRGKFVQNDPENAEMDETYTVGVNYAVPNRFSVQFLQPDDQIWRYSLKTRLQLGRKFNLNFARANSDLPDYSLGLRYQNPRGFSVSVTQPNSEISHYSLGIQWRGGSRIRYEMSGNTSGRALKLRGSFSF